MIQLHEIFTLQRFINILTIALATVVVDLFSSNCDIFNKTPLNAVYNIDTTYLSEVAYQLNSTTSLDIK